MTTLVGWLLRGLVYGAVLGVLGAKFGWHGLVGGLLGISIVALWDISDTLSDIQNDVRKLRKNFAPTESELSSESDCDTTVTLRPKNP